MEILCSLTKIKRKKKLLYNKLRNKRCLLKVKEKLHKIMIAYLTNISILFLILDSCLYITFTFFFLKFEINFCIFCRFHF